MKKILIFLLFLIYITPCFATDYKLDNYYLQTGMGISLPFSAHLFGDLKANQALGFHPPLLQVISIGVPFLDHFLLEVGFAFWNIVVKEKKVTHLLEEKLDKTMISAGTYILEGKYFFNHVCHGWFFNGGIGGGILAIKKGNPWTTTDMNIENTGIFYKLGGGYAFPFLNQYNKKYLAALLVGIDFFYAQARK